MKTHKIPLRAILREYRITLGLSQADVAHALGLTGQAYTNMEKTGNVTLKNFVKLKNLLGIKECVCDCIDIDSE